MSRRDPFPSGLEVEILRLLAGGAEKYGIQLVRESDGALKRGTIYVTLQRMSDKGFVESREEAAPSTDIGLTRRLYRVTGLGVRALAAHELLMATPALEM